MNTFELKKSALSGGMRSDEIGNNLDDCLFIFYLFIYLLSFVSKKHTL